MGAWGHGAFDNDTACDWAGELEEAESIAVVDIALQNVLFVGDDHLDGDTACMALAACEVIARLKGNWGVRNSYTDTVDRWVEAHPGNPPGALVKKAQAAIDRIVTPPSELLELWEESEDADQWKSGVAELKGRLT